MYPDQAPARGDARVERTAKEVLREIRRFSIPAVKETAQGMHIEFYAFDPATGRMRRKRIFCNREKKRSLQKAYALDVQRRLTERLFEGWNPFVDGFVDKLPLFENAINLYEENIDKMFNSGLYRKETYVGYKSYLKNLREYARDTKPIYYLYQFDRGYCSAFLDHIFIERNCGGQTRNNYLNFLRIFSGYLLEKGYVEVKPTDGIAPIPKRMIQKTRQPIPPELLKDISRWLYDHDRAFLLACHLLYYCMIRPVELTRLRLADFNFAKHTILLPASTTKSKRDQSVTLPNKVAKLMIDLGVFSRRVESYLFSNGLRPGDTPIGTIVFRHHWDALRKALRFSKLYTFYSLKDSGITALLDRNVSTIDVRDQARHSSLAVTDIYARPKQVRANPDLINFEGDL